jgi:hypothetical protein
VLKRPMWMRLAAPAIVLALASPVWATEIEMKEKKDPKAEEQKQGTPQQKKQDPAKDAGKQEPKKKKNCPIDVMSFNTLEDMYGFVGTVDSLTLQQKQQAELAKTQAAAGTPAAQAVEWRTVDASEKTDIKAEEKKAE